jgi:phosphatidylserine decarboxylase
MGTLRHIALSGLPKFALSRTTGLLARIQLPLTLRARLYGWFAKRYNANLEEVAAPIEDFKTFAAFFRRSLKSGARPIAQNQEIVSPCDGKIITAGPIQSNRIPQVKHRDYSAQQLLQNAGLAAELTDGYQATIYLAPGDYHRVHSPLQAEVLSIAHIPGALFPVNPGAVESVPELFPRNERVVFHLRLPTGKSAAVVMVSALNVGDTLVTASVGQTLNLGDELGQFGFGSTAIVVTPQTGPRIPELPREHRVWMGAALEANSSDS